MLQGCLCEQFSRTARLWNSLRVECFPLTYDVIALCLELTYIY